MATVQRYVNTASSGGDGTTNNTSGSTAAYASLSSWEANVSGAATDDYIVDCCGTAADTTGVFINFATHITTGSVKIQGNRSDGAGYYAGTSVISTSHYRVAPASGAPIDIRETKVTIDGIQVEAAGGANQAGIRYDSIPAGSTVTIEKCRVRAASSTDYGVGSANSGVSSSSTFNIRNNLIVGFNTRGIDHTISSFYEPTINILQNTIYCDGSSVGIFLTGGAGGSAGVYNIKGNAIGNSGASNCFSINPTGTTNYDDNATEDAQGTAGEIAIGTLSNAWTSPGTTQGSDFTVKSTSSSLYNAVNPTLVTTDITGFTRDGTNHDVGAFEYQAPPSRTGTLTKTFNAATSSSAATLALKAATTSTLAAATLSSASTLALKASTSQTLAAATLSSVATVALKATTTATLGSLAPSATSALLLKATTNQILVDATLSSTGQLTSSAPTLSAATVTAITATTAKPRVTLTFP